MANLKKIMHTWTESDDVLNDKINKVATDLEINLSNFESYFEKGKINLYNYKDASSGFYIDTKGSIIYNSRYYESDFISVISGETYTQSFKAIVVFYDSNKTFVSGVNSKTFTVPEGVSFLRFCCGYKESTAEADYRETMLVKGEQLPSEFRPYYSINENNVDMTDYIRESEYKGKKINWIGDSITAGYDFDEIVCNYFGLIERDYGINASRIALNSDGSNPNNAMCVRYADMDDDADIVVVSGGTNDFQYCVSEVGSMNDTTGTTFYGALKILCEGLLAKYPNSQIFFTTPIKRYEQPYLTPTTPNSKGKSLKEYAEIIKEVCSYYSIPVCDLYSESMLNPHIPSGQVDFTMETMSGGAAYVHPNDSGRKKMARRVIGFMKQLM